MEFISVDGYMASSTQIRASFQPFQMAAAGVTVGILLLDKSLKGMGQQPRDRSLSLHSDQLDL
jgi:hypothetical protein